MDRGFGMAIERHQPMVLAYAYAIVRDHGLAEDVVQETFLSAYRQDVRLADVKNLPAWLRTVARNHAYRALRRRRNAMPPVDWPADAPGGMFESADDGGFTQMLDALRACRASLPDQQRRVIELFYEQRLSAEHIAAELSVADKTVFQTLWLARKNLRECIRQHMSRDGDGL